MFYTFLQCGNLSSISTDPWYSPIPVADAPLLQDTCSSDLRPNPILGSNWMAPGWGEMCKTHNSYLMVWRPCWQVSGEYHSYQLVIDLFQFQLLLFLGERILPLVTSPPPASSSNISTPTVPKLQFPSFWFTWNCCHQDHHRRTHQMFQDSGCTVGLKTIFQCLLWFSSRNMLDSGLIDNTHTKTFFNRLK